MSALADTHAPPAALSSDWLSGPSGPAPRRRGTGSDPGRGGSADPVRRHRLAGDRHSIIWSDELASILFLWLAMLGSVVAVQRGEHMRLTFVVARSRHGPGLVRGAGNRGGLRLPVLLMHAAYDYTEDQSFVETPALGWSAPCGPRGAGRLRAGPACLRVAPRPPPPGGSARVGAVLLGLVALLAVGAPVLTGMGNWALLVFSSGCSESGSSPACRSLSSFALATSAYLLTTTSTPLTIVVGRMDEG